MDVDSASPWGSLGAGDLPGTPPQTSTIPQASLLTPSKATAAASWSSSPSKQVSGCPAKPQGLFLPPLANWGRGARETLAVRSTCLTGVGPRLVHATVGGMEEGRSRATLRFPRSHGEKSLSSSYPLPRALSSFPCSPVPVASMLCIIALALHSGFAAPNCTQRFHTNSFLFHEWILQAEFRCCPPSPCPTCK